MGDVLIHFNYFVYCHEEYMVIKVKKRVRPEWLSWVSAILCIKSCQFNSQSGHKPGFRFSPPWGQVQKATDQCFSLSPFLSPLSKHVAE